MEVSNNGFTNGVHVLETPDDIIINSQVYSKDTFKPKDLSFFNLDLVTNNNFQRRNILAFQRTKLERFGAGEESHAVVKESKYKYFLQDNVDPNIIYYLDSDKTGFFHKIKKDGDNYTKIKTISPISGFYKSSSDTRYDGAANYDQKIVGQTDKYVVLYQESMWFPRKGPDLGANTWRVNTDGLLSGSYVLIDKNTLSVRFNNFAGSIDNNNAATYLLAETKEAIYVLERFSTAFRIVKFVTATNVRTSLYTKTVQLLNCDVDKYNKCFYTLYGLNDKTYLMKFSLNTDMDSVEIISETETNFALYKDTYDKFLLYSIKICNDEYFNLTVYEPNVDRWHYHANRDRFGTYHFWGFSFSWGEYFYPSYLDRYARSNSGKHRYSIFKYDEENEKYTYTSYNETSTQYIYGVLHYNNYISIIFINDRIVFYKLDPETGVNTRIFNIVGTYETIGVDKNNNVYIFDSANKCTIYNVSKAKELNAVFELDDYVYDNEDINTYINIYSKNFLDEYTKSKVKITFEGDCVFQENNKQELITYTDGPTTHIPVIITGGGNIYCRIEEEE